MDIPRRLRERRAKEGLTQEEAARLLLIPVNTYARWERGAMEPRGLYLRAVLAWLEREGSEA